VLKMRGHRSTPEPRPDLEIIVADLFEKLDAIIREVEFASVSSALELAPRPKTIPGVRNMRGLQMVL